MFLHTSSPIFKPATSICGNNFSSYHLATYCITCDIFHGHWYRTDADGFWWDRNKYESLVSLQRWRKGGCSACTGRSFNREWDPSDRTLTVNVVFGGECSIYNGNLDYWEDDQSDTDSETYREDMHRRLAVIFP